jgi:hypothetical protein
MKYLESSMNFSLQKPPITPQYLKMLTLIVIIIYVVVVGSLDITNDVGYARNKDIDEYAYAAISAMYDTLYIVSTGIAIFSIFRIYKTVK